MTDEHLDIIGVRLFLFRSVTMLRRGVEEIIVTARRVIVDIVIVVIAGAVVIVVQGTGKEREKNERVALNKVPSHRRCSRFTLINFEPFRE